MVEESTNLLEELSLYGNAKKQQQPVFEDDDYDDEEEEDLGECDPDGSVAICEECSKIVPKSKLSKHKDYFCKN